MNLYVCAAMSFVHTRRGGAPLCPSSIRGAVVREAHCGVCRAYALAHSPAPGERMRESAKLASQKCKALRAIDYRE